MGRRFIACDREQSFLMAPDVRGWLSEGHFAWLVLDAVALLLCAYARGVRSWRAIERSCIEDVADRVIAAQQEPDHATIARFVERHQDGWARCSARCWRCAGGPGWSA
jgi:hypothetical protein